MRRGDKEIGDVAELHRILDDARVMRLAVIDGEQPYVVPLNFARELDRVWFHCAADGRKVRCLTERPRVCIEVDHLVEVTGGPSACGDWTSHYESVIGFGVATIVGDEGQRLHGLRTIMAKYSGTPDWEFSPEVLAKTVVVRVDLDGLTGKRSPAPPRLD
jgi:uncharacterized protein